MKKEILLVLFPLFVHAEIVSDIVQDTEGTPLSDILVTATSSETSLSTRTGTDGSFSFDLEPGTWFIEVSPTELLERGYFCVPGFCWPPEDPSCGPDPGLIDAVPLNPQLTITFPTSTSVAVQLDFDWEENLQPLLLRQFVIEKSTDGETWQPLQTVALQDPPIMVEDAEEVSSTCIYRAVGQEDIIITEPLAP